MVGLTVSARALLMLSFLHGTSEGWITVERVSTRVVVVELTVRARALLMLSSTWHQRRVDNSREGQYKGGGGGQQ